MKMLIPILTFYLIFALGYVKGLGHHDLKCYFCEPSGLNTTSADCTDIQNCADLQIPDKNNKYVPICYNKGVIFHGARENRSGKYMGCHLKDESVDDPCEWFKRELHDEEAILKRCHACEESLCNSNTEHKTKEQTPPKLPTTPTPTIECYRCVATIGSDSLCEMSPKNVSKQECTPGFQCNMHIITDGSTSTIYRDCSEASKCNVLSAFYSTPQAFGKKVETCEVCNTNLCNGGIGLSFTYYSTLIFSVIPTIVTYFIIINKY